MVQDEDLNMLVNGIYTNADGVVHRPLIVVIDENDGTRTLVVSLQDEAMSMSEINIAKFLIAQSETQIFR